MLMEMLMLFIIIVIVMLILGVYTMEETPILAIPVIMIGMIFSVICTYGLWDVEYVVVGYNASSGLSETSIYSTVAYGDPYSYIFMIIFYIFCMLFVKAGANMWRETLKTKGEMNYKYRMK